MVSLFCEDPLSALVDLLSVNLTIKPRQGGLLLFSFSPFIRKSGVVPLVVFSGVGTQIMSSVFSVHR